MGLFHKPDLELGRKLGLITYLRNKVRTLEKEQEKACTDAEKWFEAFYTMSPSDIPKSFYERAGKLFIRWREIKQELETAQKALKEAIDELP